LYERFPCNDRAELCKREGEVIREIGTINKQIAGRTVKEWYVDNRDKHLAKCKNWQANNHDKCLEYKKKWRENNPEYIREYHKDRCSRKRSLTP